MCSKTKKLKKGLFDIIKLNVSWNKNKEMKNRHLRERSNTNLLRLSSWLSLVGTERRRKEILRPMKIMIVKWEKILTSFLSGTKEEKFWHPILRTWVSNVAKYTQSHYLEEKFLKEQQFIKDTNSLQDT